MLTKAQKLDALDREFDGEENRERGSMTLPDFLRRREEIQKEPDPKPNRFQAEFDEIIRSIRGFIDRKLAPFEERVRGAAERLDNQHKRIEALEEKVAALEAKAGG